MSEYKLRADIPMSSSIMPQWKLPRTILIFTLITIILHSVVKGKPNTYWSKRSGKPQNKYPKMEVSIYQKQKEQKGLAFIHSLQFFERLKDIFIPEKSPNFRWRRLGSSLLGLHTLDPPLSPPSTSDMCLIYHL